MKLFLFWISYLYIPFTIAAIFVAVRKNGMVRMLAGLAVLASSVLAYARFVEPRILAVERSEIDLANANAASTTIRLALFSDTHFGIFKNAMPMQRIVDRINAEAPDAVLIAGDFLYHLAPEDIPAALAPLQSLQAPVFAVLGNHDVGFPGPVYSADLYSALNALGATLVENRAYTVKLGGRDVIIAGTSDLWQHKQNYDFTADLPDLPILLLTHNPDIALSAPASFDYDLMLAGHTHGGQVRLPGLINRVIPTSYPFDKGLHLVQIGEKERSVYVTTGTGMVGLPLRFNMPPRVDIITLRLPAPP
jgi:predicted MPP superfamily phosphohydrolase